MNRDPLFQSIWTALAQPLDPAKFQLAAQRLLADEYSGLAIMEGGNDAGMDGAIPSVDGSYPLVVTTSDDVLANLRRNLARDKKEREGLGPLRAVVATSEELTPLRRRNLEKEASSLGFLLINIHDRLDIAWRLYRLPSVRRDLLGIPGNPDALSAMPSGTRALTGGNIIGRDADLEWLKATKGDLLVVGQPGSGKTFLHQQLSLSGQALFAVDSDRGRLADAVRSMQPAAVVIDDAHTNEALLEAVLAVRAQTYAEFSIHANCWPGMHEPIARKLQLAGSQVRTLEALTADEVVVLIEANGIVGPPQLLHVLVKQAEGKPGLVVALVNACKRYDLSEVWSGNVLARELVRGGRAVRNSKEKAVLAAFALGGGRGLSTKIVANALELPVVDAWQIVTNLGAGGVLETLDDGNLQVRPDAMRGVLVAEVFFGEGAIPPARLLSECASNEETAHVLMSAARHRQVPLDLIEGLIVQSRDPRVWDHYTQISSSTAWRVLRHHPNRICAGARGLLHYVGDAALDALIDTAARSERGTIDDLVSPREKIAAWLAGDETDEEDAAQRRLDLLAGVERGVASGNLATSPSSLAWALSIILQPGFHRSAQKPGKGDHFVYSHGLISEQALRAVASARARICTLMQRVPVDLLGDVLPAVNAWCSPGRFGMMSRVPTEISELMITTGTALLREMATRDDSSPALLTWIADQVAHGSLDLVIDVHPIYDLLYSSRVPGADYNAEHTAQMEAITALAAQLVDSDPVTVLRDQIRLEQEAARLPSRMGRQRILHREIALRSGARILVWLDAAVAAEASADVVSEYLSIALEREQPAALVRLRQLLGKGRYAQLAVWFSLQLADAPEQLLDDALCLMETESIVVRTALFNTRVLPMATMCRLLTHASVNVRVFAALHESASNNGLPRPALEPAWRAAILVATTEDDFHLRSVLAANRNLAFDWVVTRLVSGSRELWRLDEIFTTVVSAFAREQRQSTLRLITEQNFDDELFDLLVGEDETLYAEWFAFQRERYTALRPLRRRPDDRWQRMAIVALNQGATDSEIAEHCTANRTGVISGPFSEYYRGMIPLYEALTAHLDARLHRAGRVGLEGTRAAYEAKLRDERREDVRGL